MKWYLYLFTTTYLVEHIANGAKGHADLCAYFFLRVADRLGKMGGFGLLATNTIAQGDTREVGLDQLTQSGCTIPRAIQSRKWPGTASLEVAHVWCRKGNWNGKFVLAPEEAQTLIEKNAKNKDVLFPYLNGEDLNSRSDQSPSRWVINFFDWPIERAMQYPDCFKIVEEKVKPERQRRKDNVDYALRKPLPQKWWIYADKRPALYSTIAGMERVTTGVCV